MTTTRNVRWGPWLEHNGAGCPVRVGSPIRFAYERANGTPDIGVSVAISRKAHQHPSWRDENFGKRVTYDGVTGLCGRVTAFQAPITVAFDVLRDIARRPKAIDTEIFISQSQEGPSRGA